MSALTWQADTREHTDHRAGEQQQAWMLLHSCLPETAGDTGLGETFLYKTQSTNYCLSSAYKPKRAAGHIQAQLQYLELKKRHLSEHLTGTLTGKLFPSKEVFHTSFVIWPCIHDAMLMAGSRSRAEGNADFEINGSAWLLAVQEKMRCMKNFFLVNLYFTHLHHSRETKLHRLS